MRTLSVKLVLTSAIATLLCAMPVSIGSSGSEDHPSSNVSAIGSRSTPLKLSSAGRQRRAASPVWRDGAHDAQSDVDINA